MYITLDVLRLDDGADHWLMLGEKGWIDDGPPAEFFDELELFGPDAWDDEDDWEDDEDDEDDYLWPGAQLYALELDFAVCNKLAANGVTTPEQLDAMSDADILAIHGIGKKTLQAIRNALAAWKE